jgi:hypothetical protein
LVLFQWIYSHSSRIWIFNKAHFGGRSLLNVSN